MKTITIKMGAENKKEVTAKAKALCKKYGYKKVVSIKPTSEMIRYLHESKKIYLVKFEE